VGFPVRPTADLFRPALVSFFSPSSVFVSRLVLFFLVSRKI
jgi:hypothetical protein